ncbi:14959_t:CDS:2, partial [Gigaspora margarita]
MARQKLRTKEWKTNYKRGYCTKKQRRTKHENCYNDNLHTATNNTSWWDNLNTLDKTVLSSSVFLWNRRCNYCSTALLTGELSEFCYNHGKRMLPRLLSYPMNIDNIINNYRCSSYSRKPNILFSFTAIGVQGQFVALSAPSTVCITGRTYHHMLPIDTPNHSLNWYIYDEQERYITAQKQKIPNDWVSTIRTMLTQVNPYISWLRTFQRNFTYNTILELRKNSSTGEIAAIMHADNIVNIHPYFEDEIDENEEENLHLPASFLGSKRWCSSH